MKAFHDSRDIRYRTPFGAVAPGMPVTLRLDVWDAPGATVSLRTWIDGVGESVLEMTPDGAPSNAANGPTTYCVSITPEDVGVIWYHFIIVEAGGAALRYGAQDGRFGGVGQLRDWEPPSFQLTAIDPDATDEIVKEVFYGTNPMMRPPAETMVGFLRNETTARELSEALETLRETCPEETFERAFDLLGSYSQPQLFALLAGASATEAAAPEPPVNYHTDPAKGGLAKGRLWATCLLHMLAPKQPIAREEDRMGTTSSLLADSTVIEGHEDADCEAIVENACDVHRTLPLFSTGAFQSFAMNEDVFGFWRTADDGTAACVLVNASLEHAYDVPIPLVNEAVSDILGGYGVKIVNADEAVKFPGDVAESDRYALAHLYQLGTAILFFHPEQRVEQPMEPGLGVLAHITSLPSDGKDVKADASADGVPAQLGTLGAPARAFVDWLADAGVRYWQVLPVNPTDEYGSPYAGISAFAGNARLLGDLEAQLADFEDSPAYQEFCQHEADWLEPYATFMAIRETVDPELTWQEWPKRYRRFTPKLADKNAALRKGAEKWRRTQFIFEREWRSLRAYANERGVQIIGDMPIYVSADSSDVWANPGIFQLGEDGTPDVVAGCPPDAFAEEGQIWGNPIYNWDALADDGYAWWLRRLERSFDLYDYVRLDHFIGFCRYYSIPAGQKATTGTYEEGPGMRFFQAAFQKFGPLPIIAEDLGAITPAVRALVAACGFPGMDIVQFVDGNDPHSGYQPRPEKVAYTGTHDNQTLVGYVEARYPDLDAKETALDLMEKVAACDAPVSILPLQDLMLLDDDARMNIPGTSKGNWTWQADEDAMADAADVARKLVELHRETREVK